MHRLGEVWRDKTGGECHGLRYALQYASKFEPLLQVLFVLPQVNLPKLHLKINVEHFELMSEGENKI